MRSHLAIALGAFSGFIAVAAGAFGAHGLKSRLSPDMMSTFEIGVRYQMYHALLLVLLGVIMTRGEDSTLPVAGWLVVAGTLLFSGSLYVLTLTGQRWLGAVTPLGGLCFLLAWLLLAYSALRGLR